MLNFWTEILQNFHRVLQNENVNLKTCAGVYGSLPDQVCTSRDKFERYEAATKEMLPDVDYKAVQTHKCIRKKVPNDGDVPEVCLIARDNFVSPTFTQLLTNLKLR